MNQKPKIVRIFWPRLLAGLPLFPASVEKTRPGVFFCRRCRNFLVSIPAGKACDPGRFRSRAMDQPLEPQVRPRVDAART
jgi:hypothetical protein